MGEAKRRRNLAKLASTMRTPAERTVSLTLNARICAPRPRRRLGLSRVAEELAQALSLHVC